MTSPSRSLPGLALLAALAGGCGGDAQTPGPAQHVAVRVKLSNAGCDAGRITDFRAFQVALLAPDSRRSACVTGRPQSFDAIHDTLAGKIAFDDLPEGQLTVKLEGYRDDGCRSDKLGMCGLGTVRLAAEVMEVEIPIACDDGASAVFTACVAR
jgi:hypothetical protein